jgi:hypothetical protein
MSSAGGGVGNTEEQKEQLSVSKKESISNSQTSHKRLIGFGPNMADKNKDSNSYNSRGGIDLN